jgi:hypothetical protein
VAARGLLESGRQRLIGDVVGAKTVQPFKSHSWVYGRALESVGDFKALFYHGQAGNGLSSLKMLGIWPAWTLPNPGRTSPAVDGPALAESFPQVCATAGYIQEGVWSRGHPLGRLSR